MIIRITPAGAGKTGIASVYSKAERDHPRRCGENVFRMIKIELRLGSPPQVRGKHHIGKEINVKDGITPAGAGKTAVCTGRNFPP